MVVRTTGGSPIIPSPVVVVPLFLIFTMKLTLPLNPKCLFSKYSRLVTQVPRLGSVVGPSIAGSTEPVTRRHDLRASQGYLKTSPLVL